LKAADALMAEDAASEAADVYGNVIAVRKGDENRPGIQKLTQVMQSPEVKNNEKYAGAVVPTF